MTDEDIEKIIKRNMNLQMNLAGIRADFEEALQRQPLTEQFIMDSTRELSRDFRWPSTMIDVWRLCEAAHGITGEKK